MQNKQNSDAIYELFTENDKTMIRRKVFPRFVGEFTFGSLTDIENIVWKDTCTNVAELAVV